MRAALCKKKYYLEQIMSGGAMIEEDLRHGESDLYFDYYERAFFCS